MNIVGAKFEEHWLYIFRDILYSVFYHLSCKSHDVITFKTKKDIPKGKRHSYFFWKAFQIGSNYFQQSYYSLIF